MIFKFKKLLIVLFICSAGISFAQDLSLSAGADVVSRYIWRGINVNDAVNICLLYTSPSPRDRTRSRMPSSA